MTSLSSRSASAYFLAVSFLGASGVLRMVDHPGDHQSGPCSAWAPGEILIIDAIRARYS